MNISSQPTTSSSESAIESTSQQSSLGNTKSSKYNKDKYLTKTLGMCCENMCMFNISSDVPIAPKDVYCQATQRISECQRRLQHLTKNEQFNLIKSEIDRGYKGISEGGHIILELTLEPGGPIICGQAFRNYYDIGYTTYKKLCKQVKERKLNSEPDLTVKNSRGAALKRRDCKLSFFNIPNSDELLAMEYCPDSPKAMQTYVWMKSYFEVMGEMMPVGWGQRKEIHLDSGTLKTEIWKEYKYV